jgi:hypothetical protein
MSALFASSRIQLNCQYCGLCRLLCGTVLRELRTIFQFSSLLLEALI